MIVETCGLLQRILHVFVFQAELSELRNIPEGVN